MSKIFFKVHFAIIINTNGLFFKQKTPYITGNLFHFSYPISSGNVPIVFNTIQAMHNFFLNI